MGNHKEKAETQAAENIATKAFSRICRLVDAIQLQRLGRA
jgi:hypothetical protein